MNESSCVAFETYFFLLLNILFLVGDKARHIISTKRHDMTDRSRKPHDVAKNINTLKK